MVALKRSTPLEKSSFRQGVRVEDRGDQIVDQFDRRLRRGEKQKERADNQRPTIMMLH